MNDNCAATFVGCSPAEKTLQKLHGKAEYFHIKDVVAKTGELVPAGYGDGKIGELVEKITSDKVLTLEPHLAIFDAYKSIDNAEMKHKFSYASGGERVGIYYCEKGASQRPSKVVYDRAYSAIAMAKKSDFDWDSIFEGVEWFHFTGITPALSEETAEICLEACKKAKEKNITISCDLNFRKKLWSKERAGQVMGELCKYVDYCIANEEDAKDVFGIEAEGSDIYGGKLNKEGYVSVAKKLTDRFDFKGVAITLRESKSANDNDWSAMLYTGGDAYFSKKYSVHIVDRVGGGDSFGGGLIYALLSDYSPQESIEFAVAASCLKHSIEGDYNLVSVSEVKALAGGNASGRVQR